MKSFELWEHTEYASVCICKRWEDEVKEEYRDMNPLYRGNAHLGWSWLR